MVNDVCYIDKLQSVISCSNDPAAPVVIGKVEGSTRTDNIRESGKNPKKVENKKTCQSDFNLAQIVFSANSRSPKVKVKVSYLTSVAKQAKTALLHGPTV